MNVPIGTIEIEITANSRHLKLWKVRIYIGAVLVKMAEFIMNPITLKEDKT